MNYFDLIPQELINITLYYIDNYDTFINLYRLTIFKSVIDSPYFWKNLFKFKLGYLIEALPINFNSKNIYYIVSSYNRTSIAFDKYIKLFNFLVNRVNEGIKKYYPNMDIDNITFDKIEEDDSNQRLQPRAIGSTAILDLLLNDAGLNIRFDQKFLDVSLMFDPKIIHHEDYEQGIFAKYYKDGIELSEDCELRMYPWDYGIVIWQVDNFIDLTKEQFQKLLLYAYFQGANIHVWNYDDSFQLA